MGKRQQLRTTINLHVQGPKRIMARSVFGVASLKQSWYQFLASCGVKLTPDDGIYVQTNYLKSKYRQGWTANLNNEIGDMLEDFRHVKKIYSVRLRFDLEGNTPNDGTVIEEGQQRVSGPNLNKRLRICRNKNEHPAPRSNNTIRPTRFPKGKASAKISGVNLLDKLSSTERVTSNPLRRSETGQKTINTQSNHDEIANFSAGRNMESMFQNHNTTGGEVRNGSNRLQSIGTPSGAREMPNIRFTEQPIVHSPVTFQVESQNEEYWQQENTETTSETPDVVDMSQISIGEIKVVRCDVGAEAQIPEEDDDNLSFITVTDVTTQENELHRQGIPIEDVQSQVDERMKKMFNNRFLMHIKQEINNKRGTDVWTRIVSKAPISAYFLQELFKQE